MGSRDYILPRKGFVERKRLGHAVLAHTEHLQLNILRNIDLQDRLVNGRIIISCILRRWVETIRQGCNGPGIVSNEVFRISTVESSAYSSSYRLYFV
jgi:hypothetical protein